MMDIRERLVELLNGIIDGGFKWHSYSYESGEQLNNDEITSHLIANGVTIKGVENDTVKPVTDCHGFGEWIPVTERLPSDEKEVLVYYGFGNLSCKGSCKLQWRV